MEEKNEITERREPNTNILVVGKVDKQNIILGDADSFIRYTSNVPMQAILWNEEYLIAKTNDRGTLIAYKPEIEPTTAMFFSREHKRGSYSSGGRDEMRVWEGEYNPVEFTKGNLISFIKQHSNKETSDQLLDAVKNMKVIEKQVSASEMIDLGSGEFDDQNVRTVEEETAITNIPSKFKLHMPLFQNYSADFYFEAKVVRADDGYGNAKGKRVIQLRVVNAREVMREVMFDILGKLPKDVPTYYGKMSIGKED